METRQKLKQFHLQHPPKSRPGPLDYHTGTKPTALQEEDRGQQPTNEREKIAREREMTTLTFILQQLFKLATLYPANIIKSAIVEWSQRRRSQVARAPWLWCRKSPEGCEFKAGLR